MQKSLDDECKLGFILTDASLGRIAFSLNEF